MTSRLVIGGIAAAAVIAGTTGAVALAGPSSAPTPKTTASPGIAADPNVARVAAQLGVSADRLLQALPKAKLATMTSGSLTGDAAGRALATDLGVSPARAQRALRELVKGHLNLPVGGREMCPLTVTRSARWWPRDLPGAATTG
jgi:hypothetical protein